MQEKIKNLIREALGNLDIEASSITVEHPADLTMGDYSTNIALAIAKNINENPKALAEKIVAELVRANTFSEIEKIDVAGPGFINFYLSRKFFRDQTEEILNAGKGLGTNQLLAQQKIMIEYTDPNPFKPFHIGHLMTNAIGESIARILEHSGAEVSRANYQGDVGLHVAKAIYGLLKDESLQDITVDHNAQAANIGKAYVMGAEEYENNGEAKEAIEEINKKVYDKSDENINAIYEWGFKATMEAFEDLYKLLGTKFDFYFLESNVAIPGERIVRENIGKVFTESDGAIVFKGELHDPKLHTRVFITSKGLPTYETKELGLAEEKFTANPDMVQSITVTANEQKDYMRIVYKALSLIHPMYESKMKHITHGMMRLQGGKMSSRKGNVITGESLIRDTIALVEEKVEERGWDEEEKKNIAELVGVAAIKYSILKQSIGGDIIYDFDTSISFEGDSGPYLQYSYARANSVLEKAQKENILPDFEILPENTFEIEKLLYRFQEVVARASVEHEPHYIANYLIEVARSFNSFYGNTVIVHKEDPLSQYKVALTYAFSFVMKKGLYLLGIQAPSKM